MNLCIFEDANYRKLLPLCYFRPVYDLKCGIFSLREKIERFYPGSRIALHVRDYLSAVVAEMHPGLNVNKIPGEAGDVLFLNGRQLMSEQVVRILGARHPGTDTVFLKNGTLVAAWVSGQNLEHIRSLLVDRLLDPALFASVAGKELPEARLVNFPWDLVRENGGQINEDFKSLTGGSPGILGRVYQGVHLLNASAIHIGEGASVKPGVVLDAEEGPIYVSGNVKIKPNAVIEGPAFIGEGSIVKIGAKIYENTTIGETCKVGGEVEESIIHAFSNKQHEGFLGHAYLGEWVNIGADSNNSDLKNDYGNVKVYNDGAAVDTGSQFVGLTMGDHSKCGINSMFNTGSVVSVCCNIFGTGTPPKYVPSFSWGGAGDGFVTYKIDKAVDVAKKVMARRKITMSEETEKLFRKVFAMTMKERLDAGIGDQNR